MRASTHNYVKAAVEAGAAAIVVLQLVQTLIMTQQFKVTINVSSFFTDLIHVEIISFVVVFSLILIIALLNLIVCIINCKPCSNSNPSVSL